MAKKKTPRAPSIVAMVQKRMAQMGNTDGLTELAQRLAPIKKFGFNVKVTTGKNVGITISGENWPKELRRIIRTKNQLDKFDFSQTETGNKGKRNLDADRVEEIVIEATARTARKNAG
jgi:hypothetical protein